jgi:hypothetical protein
MLTTAEQQELRQIEEGLRAHERGYARRMTLVQGLLRWAAPGRQRYLLALATVAGGATGIPDRGVAVVRGSRQVVA